MKEEILEIIKSEKKRLKNINLMSGKILKTDYKPEVKIYPKFLYDCFLIINPIDINNIIATKAIKVKNKVCITILLFLLIF